MANHEIDIPPGDKGVQLYQGDTLTIKFKSSARFCITQGNADCFSPPLPVNQAKSNGDSYVGTVTCQDATILYTHVAGNKDCGSGKGQVPPGTIQIGSGIKK